ncbi:MAG: hypothetical protein HY540_08175 [Deltaproteobacteria bacterium]|nr:hypothetical protein [Deltaproteobacteria bacterium]
MMKQILLLSLLLSLTPLSAKAVEGHTIYITLPANFAQKICEDNPGRGKSIVWKGVEDKRDTAEIGLQTKSGQEVKVYADPSPAEMFGKEIQKIFKVCGVNLVKKGASEVQVDILDFQTLVQKKLVTGSNTAVSKIRFHLIRGAGQSTSVDVGFEMEAKGIRRMGFRSMEQTANDLFLKTLEQIPTSELFSLL